jgi:hypothetical protein
MNGGRVVHDHDNVDHLITLRDSMLGYIARGESLRDVVRELDKAIQARLLREKRERAA